MSLLRSWLLVLIFSGFRQAGWAQVSPAADYATRAGRDIAVLTSDSLAGRGYGPADGARKAARYLAQRFRELGLEPMGDSAGSFFQPFKLPVNTFPGELSLALDGRGLRPGYDFIAMPACPATQVKGKVVEFDTSLFSQQDSVGLLRRLRPRSLQHRVLVVRASDEKRLAKLPAGIRRWIAGAAAVLVREPRKLTASLAQEQARQPWLRVLDSAWVRGPRPRRATLRVSARFEPAYPVVNVIGRLRGSSPADSVLVVTAHYDHLGQQGPAVTFYGANDNASGTAMLLQLAAALGQERPRHDVIFIAFGAEEAGLVGSGWCAAHPPVPLTRIRFLLNLDLEGFGDKGATVVNATLHPRRFQLLDSLARTGAEQTAMPPFLLKQRGRAANSDHFPFSERGVPAFFVYSLGGPGYYHDVRDRAATLRLTDAYRLYDLLRRFVLTLDAAP